MNNARNNCPTTNAVSVDVAPILGIRKMGAAKIPTPKIPPIYRYHSDMPGICLKFAVVGKSIINKSSIRILTQVSNRTDPKFPVFCPRPAFKTLWSVISEPARMPITKNINNFINSFPLWFCSIFYV